MSDPPPRHVFVEALPSTEKIATKVAEGSPQVIPDCGTRDPVAASTVASAPSLSDSLTERSNTVNPCHPSKQGNAKVLSRTNISQTQQKAPCGDKAKRRRVRTHLF